MVINPTGTPVQQIRTMDRTVYITRERRIYSTYSPYYSRPIVVYNSSPYNSYFWWWMLVRRLEELDMWAYCHRFDMYSARYQALLAHDANLEARIRQLETQKAAVNPSYTPTGIDPDLQYTDNFVDSVYNPHVETPAGTVYNPHVESRPGTVYNPHVETRPQGHGLRTLFWILVGGTLLFAAIYLVFYHNWQFCERTVKL